MIGLSKPQKRALILLARRSWSAECARLRGERGPAAEQPDFDTWRHAQVRAACGKAGLTLCLQPDFPWLMAHFLNLVGQDGAAFKWLMRAQEDPRKQAWTALQRTMEARGISPNYAETVCRSVCDCDLATATTPQLWRLRGLLLHRGPSAHTAPAPAPDPAHA